MGGEVQLVEDGVFDFFVEAAQGGVDDERGNDLGEATEGFKEGEGANLALAGGGVGFLPGGRVAVAAQEGAVPVLVEVHAEKFALALGDLHPEVPDMLGDFMAQL